MQVTGSNSPEGVRAIAAAVIDRTGDSLQWIGGGPQVGTGDDRLGITNPANGESILEFTGASTGDVEQAVAAAQQVLPEWAGATPGTRAAALIRLSHILADRGEEFACVESLQCGKPIRLAREFDVPGTVDNVAFFAGTARHLQGQASAEYSSDHTSSIRREPLGVIGSIAPWNYPLQMAGWKILPAIAAGNTIVLKPAEITPLTTLMFAQACSDAGIPDGVVNVVTGTGPLVGEALVSHHGIAMTSFTGSTPVGRRVAALASANGTRLHLELGGKAPFVVFDDADLDAAIHGAVAAALINGGQDCTAATRAYVQRPLYEAFVAGVADLMAGVVMGDPQDGDVDLGPLISHRHRDRVAQFVARAVQGGAKALTGGTAPAGALAAGAYYAPTLVVDAGQDSEIVQQEVFGPVLVVLAFDSDDQGLELACDTPFGLAASAWTRDVFRAQRAARTIPAGCVWINDHIPIVSEMPHGGFRASGVGKDMSQYSFEEYTQVKHVMSDITGVARKGWHRTVFSAR